MLAVAAAALLIFLAPMLVGYLLSGVLDARRESLPSLLALAAGLVAGFAGLLIVGQRLALLGNGTLRRDLAAKLTGAGVPQPVLQGRFVGIAVGLERMQYEGDTDWDVGFLNLEPGRLLYLGDQTWFGLRPDQVQWVDLYPPKYSGPLTEIRLRISWSDPWTRQYGLLTLAERDFRSRKESFEKLERLHREIEAWRTTPSTAPDYSLPLPPMWVAGGAPTVGAEPGSFGLQLAIGIPLAIVMGLGLALLKKLLGLNIPVWTGILFAILITQGIAAAVESARRSRR